MSELFGWYVNSISVSQLAKQNKTKQTKNPQSLCLIGDTIFILPMKKSEDLSMPVTFKSSPVDFNMHP